MYANHVIKCERQFGHHLQLWLAVLVIRSVSAVVAGCGDDEDEDDDDDNDDSLCSVFCYPSN